MGADDRRDNNARSGAPSTAATSRSASRRGHEICHAGAPRTVDDAAEAVPMRELSAHEHSLTPVPQRCGTGQNAHVFLQPSMVAAHTGALVKSDRCRYKVRPINENRWRRQWTSRCLPPSPACARGPRRRTRPDGGFRSSAFSRQAKQQTSESADRFFRLTQWICIMTARFPNGGITPRPTSFAKADPAASALQRGNDTAPATSLSGAFKAALGKPADPPHNQALKKGGAGQPTLSRAGPLKGPGKTRTNSPAASVPRKGHR